MSEQPPSAIGTVAQEAARLIEEMATMARSSLSRSDEHNRYADEPAEETWSPDPPPAPRPDAADPPDPARAASATADPHQRGEHSPDACSVCGREAGDAPQRAAACRLCPLCRGIDLLRSVRPETVDMMADLAVALAASLRDVATRSRAAAPASSATSASGRPPEGDRSTVHDIPVDDEREV